MSQWPTSDAAAEIAAFHLQQIEETLAGSVDLQNAAWLPSIMTGLKAMERGWRAWTFPQSTARQVLANAMHARQSEYEPSGRWHIACLVESLATLRLLSITPGTKVQPADYARAREMVMRHFANPPARGASAPLRAAADRLADHLLSEAEAKAAKERRLIEALIASQRAAKDAPAFPTKPHATRSSSPAKPIASTATFQAASDPGGTEHCANGLTEFIAARPGSWRPRCLCPELGDYVQFLSDNLPDDRRAELHAFVPRLIRTLDAALERQRVHFFAWQTIRVFVPAALMAQGCRRQAGLLRHARSFGEAADVAHAIQRALENARPPGDPPPLELALHRAYRAALAAPYVPTSTNGVPEPYDQFSSCGYLAASAAFHAWHANVTEAWDLAFQCLNDALSITAEPEGPRTCACTPAHTT